MKETDWHIFADNMRPYRFGLLRLVLDTCEYFMTCYIVLWQFFLFMTVCLSFHFRVFSVGFVRTVSSVVIVCFSSCQFREVTAETK